MAQKVKTYYRGKSADRKLQIVKWFFELVNQDDNTLMKIKHNYINGNEDIAIDDFTDFLESMSESFFGYIANENMEHDFLRRCLPFIAELKDGGGDGPIKPSRIKIIKLDYDVKYERNGKTISYHVSTVRYYDTKIKRFIKVR